MTSVAKAERRRVRGIVGAVVAGLMVLLPVLPASAGASPLVVGGGADVPDGRYPFMAELVSGQDHLCGASLVAPRVFVTAAHCLAFPFDDEIRVGATDRTDPDQGATYSIIRAAAHPRFGFDGEGFYGPDIAFIEVSEDVVGIEPIEMVASGTYPDEDLVGQSATAMGWGIQRDDTVPDRLIEVDLQLLDPPAWSDRVIHTDGDAGVSNGDSGGPLVQVDPVDGKLTQLGIVSGAFDYGDGVESTFTALGAAAIWDTLAESDDGAYFKALLAR